MIRDVGGYILFCFGFGLLRLSFQPIGQGGYLTAFLYVCYLYLG
jgi:hypothetical protein